MLLRKTLKNFLLPKMLHRATEPQSHRATEPQSHRATEPQSHRATEPQSHRATEPQSHRATEPQSHRATEPQSHRATEPQSHRATEPQSHRTGTFSKNSRFLAPLVFSSLLASSSVEASIVYVDLGNSPYRVSKNNNNNNNVSGNFALIGANQLKIKVQNGNFVRAVDIQRGTGGNAISLNFIKHSTGTLTKDNTIHPFPFGGLIATMGRGIKSDVFAGASLKIGNGHDIYSVNNTWFGAKSANGGGTRTNYVGFTAVSGATNYMGWMQLRVSTSRILDSSVYIVQVDRAEILKYAYNDDGSITAGQIPEPANTATGLGLLALGAVGVKAMRARKRKSIETPAKAE